MTASVPPEFRSATGLSFVIDTNRVDDESDDMRLLRSLHFAGSINLTRTDTMDTELSGAKTPKRRELLEASGQFVEHMGPLVLDHSRLGKSVLGGDDDRQRLEKVFSLLFPGVERSMARKQHTRDSMHIATAIRYGASGFVTSEKRLLNKSEAVADAFNGFQIYDAKRARQTAERFIAKAKARQDRQTAD